MTIAYIVVGGLIATTFSGIWISSRRFERRRMKEGEWDANGPKHPTKPSRFLRRGRLGNGLAFDMRYGLDRDEDWPGGQKPRFEGQPPDELSPDTKS